MCKLAPKGSKLIQTLRASMHRSWHVDCIVLIWTFTVEGHKGRLIFGTLAGKCVMCMQGRVHGYEGYSQTKVSSSNYWEFPCSSQPVYGTQCLNSSLSVTLRVRGHHCQWHSVSEVITVSDTPCPRSSLSVALSDRGRRTQGHPVTVDCSIYWQCRLCPGTLQFDEYVCGSRYALACCRLTLPALIFLILALLAIENCTNSSSN